MVGRMNVMHNIHDVDQWEQLKKSSGESEIIIFKFSPTCPISRSIEHEFDAWFDNHEEKPLVCAKVDVIRARPLSQHLANEFGVRHESPQVLWLGSDRSVKWSASHHQISKQTLEQNLCDE